MKQRIIRNDIAPDFARVGQQSEDYIENKANKIVEFIKGYLQKSRAKGIVLGISGGVDSFLVGALCAKACAQLKNELYLCILPNKEQSDYKDAADSIDSIRMLYPELKADTISIENGFYGAQKDLEHSKIIQETPYVTGNIQARLRMVYQYAMGVGMLVAGTDHATESVTGFFTKFGDGAADIMPIAQLIKDDIYKMSQMLGAPEEVMRKAPAAGLGISKTDEEELGVCYDDICLYLRGKKVAQKSAERIEWLYEVSRHKRAMPANLNDAFNQKDPITNIVVGADRMDAKEAKGIINYINETPEQMVLYLSEGKEQQELFYSDVKKTVNTPEETYNIFVMEENKDVMRANNHVFGELHKNIAKNVVVSGYQMDRVLKMALQLKKNGCHVCLVTAGTKGSKGISELQTVEADILIRQDLR